MAKHETENRKAKRRKGDRRKAPKQGGVEARKAPQRDEQRAAVGRGTLAAQALDSVDSAIENLQRLFTDVAALGKSLALARDQLAEQEEELDALREQVAGSRSAVS